MRIGGHRRVWAVLVAILGMLAGPADAAPKRGEIVLRGAGGITVTLPAGLRFLVPDGFMPAPSGRARGFVIREASTGGLVLAAVSVDLPGFERVKLFSRGQGYEDGRVGAGRYRITVLGDAKALKDIVLPVEGLGGSRTIALTGGAYSNSVMLSDPTGGASRYRAGTLELAQPMGLIWAWAVQRGTGLHNVQFCFVPEGAGCPPQEGVGLDAGPKSYSGSHLSVPATRPYGKYDLVLNTRSVGAAGKVALFGLIFI